VRIGGSSALLVVGLGVAILFTGSPGVLAGETGTAPSSDSPEGIHRLVLACRASAAMPYSGVQRVQVAAGSGEGISIVEVSHVPGAGERLTVRSSPSAPVSTYVGDLGGPSLLPVVDESTLVTISSRYLVGRPRPGGTVAGRATDVVELMRTSGSGAGGVAARFWLDRQTALPLQREVFDGSGRMRQASTFTSISYHPTGQSAKDVALVGRTTETGRGVSPAQLDSYRSAGWLAPGRLPDDLDLVDARMHGSGGGPPGAAPLVLQLNYTDGISVVSLFEQRGRLDSRPLASWSRQRRGGGTVWLDRGTPERAVWSARGRIYTLVSDDPGAVGAVMAALPAPASQPGLVERLWHGVNRLVSWCNPFA
jgi:hypothetical protein